MAEAVTAYIGHDAMFLLMMVVNCLIRSPSHSRVYLRISLLILLVSYELFHKKGQEKFGRFPFSFCSVCVSIS
jgi:hypothetical protein